MVPLAAAAVARHYGRALGRFASRNKYGISSCKNGEFPAPFSSTMTIEESKRLAAEKAVNDHVQDGHVVGVGSGSTIVYAVKRLAERVSKEGLNVKCIPTSFQVRLTLKF